MLHAILELESSAYLLHSDYTSRLSISYGERECENVRIFAEPVPIHKKTQMTKTPAFTFYILHSYPL